MAKTDKKSWRKACQKEMEKAALKEAKSRTGKKTPAFMYRWEHVQAVVAQALKLAKKTKADKEIVEAAAWLHDIKKFEDGPKHAKLGAKFALEFLPKTDFPAEKIDAVAAAISVHAGLWRDKPLKNLESQVLWDADKLTKIGLTAVFHILPNELLRPGRQHTTESIVAFGKNAEWQSKTVASFHTEPARKAGAKRLKSLRKMWDQVEKELAGNDL